MTPGDAGDFYEEDEPVAEVLAAFDRGIKGVTAPPGHQITEAIDADPAEVARLRQARQDAREGKFFPRED